MLQYREEVLEKDLVCVDVTLGILVIFVTSVKLVIIMTHLAAHGSVQSVISLAKVIVEKVDLKDVKYVLMDINTLLSLAALVSLLFKRYIIHIYIN